MCVNVYTKHQRCCGKCQYQNTSVCPEASLHAASTAAAASSPPPPPPATSPRATTGFLEVPVNWREHSEALPCAVFARAGGMVPTPSRAAAGLRRLHEPEMAVAAQTLVAPVFLPAALGPPAASVNSPCKKRRAVRPVDELCRQCKRDQKRRRLEAAAGSTNGEGKAAEMRGEVEKETESGDADDSGEGSSGLTGDLSFGTFETLWKTSHPPIFGSIMGRPHHRERDDSPCRPLLNTERK